jgi:hypothetical protein
MLACSTQANVEAYAFLIMRNLAGAKANGMPPISVARVSRITGST